MFSLMDGVFIKRRCYLKLGDGAVMSFIRLRADCFFRYWPLKALGIDDEGCIQAKASAPFWSNRRVSDVILRIDPMTSFLLEFSYMDDDRRRAFRLVDAEYHEQSAKQAHEPQTAD
jgi:hypothetical protein